MKQNEDNTKPDPRQILNDIAAREAEAAAGDTVKTAKGSGDDDGTDRTEPTQKGDGNAKDTQKQGKCLRINPLAVKGSEADAAGHIEGEHKLCKHFPERNSAKQGCSSIEG